MQPHAIRFPTRGSRSRGHTDRPTDDIGSYDAGQFSAMLTYADKNGWVNNDGRSLQAHIVRGDG